LARANLTEQSDDFRFLLKDQREATMSERYADKTANRISDVKTHLGKSRDTDGYRFRPLTEEEKQQFVNSLDAQGRQLLAEVAGQAIPSIGSIEENEAPFSGLRYEVGWPSVTWSVK
jgi:hypothetical protein